MSLTVLNSVSSLTAENALSNTQAALQKTLNQLSTGLKINSGSDDAAGLSIADGLQANIAALTQSQQNAANGIGLLQTADGALSQVTDLLNRAVTLATEASNTGLLGSQSTALDGEFQSILAEINQIGTSTDFNGQNVFTSNAPTSFTSVQGSLATSTALTSGDTVTISDSLTGGTFVFKAGGSNTINDLINAVSTAAGNGTLSAGVSAAVTAGHLVISTNTASDSIQVADTDPTLGAMNATTANNSSTVFISDGVTTNNTISTTINTLSATSLSLNGKVLTSTTSAQTALTAIVAAINTVAAQRGVIGASVNRLTSASNDMSNAVTNLQSADNSVENADIGKTVADMTQYNVLQSTGMAALQQSNQAQQAVLKLVQ